MARSKKDAQMNPFATFGGQMQTIGGRLAIALGRRGLTIMDFVAWLAQFANEDAIEQIVALVPDKEQIAKIFQAALTFFAEEPAVRIGCSDSFKVCFYDYTILLSPANIKKAFTLDRVMTDDQIIAKLGGVKKAVTTLQDIWLLLLMQPKGEAGELLVNGYANVFCVKDSSGVLRTVSVYWGTNGWGVFANTLCSRPWCGGSQVFSPRNS